MRVQLITVLCQEIKTWEYRTELQSTNDIFDLLQRLLSKLTLDGVNIRFDLKKPFAILAEMARKSDWRSRAGAYRTWFIQNPQININNIHMLLVA